MVQGAFHNNQDTVITSNFSRGLITNYVQYLINTADIVYTVIYLLLIQIHFINGYYSFLVDKFGKKCTIIME